MSSMGLEPAPATAPADLRRQNLLRVLTALRDRGPLARSELAEAAGLTRGSITGLSGLLLAAGLVEEVAPALTRGRPAPRLTIGGHGFAVLVAELTVDRIKVLCTDLAESVVHEGQAEHRGAHSTPEEIVGVLARMVRDALEASADRILTSFVLVIAAPVLDETGYVPISVDLGWREVDLRGLLRSALPEVAVRITLVGDSHMGGLAELRRLRSAGQSDLTDLLYLKSDTGVGGMAVIDDRVLRGAHRLAFTPGHMVVDPGGRRCGCGQRGCLVTVAGPERVLELAGLVDELESHHVTAATAVLVQRVHSGDSVAIAAVHEAGIWVGRLLSTLAIATDPAAIVLGGYWAEVFEVLHSGIVEEFGPQAPFFAEHYPTTMVVPAVLGSRANLIGGIDLAIQQGLTAVVGNLGQTDLVQVLN